MLCVNRGVRVLRFRTGDDAPNELESSLVERLCARDSSALSMLYDQYGDQSPRGMTRES